MIFPFSFLKRVALMSANDVPYIQSSMPRAEMNFIAITFTKTGIKGTLPRSFAIVVHQSQSTIFARKSPILAAERKRGLPVRVLPNASAGFGGTSRNGPSGKHLSAASGSAALTPTDNSIRAFKPT